MVQDIEWSSLVVHIQLTSGITQRDTNFYEHYQGADEQAVLVSRVREFYEDEIRENYAGGPNCKLAVPRVS